MKQACGQLMWSVGGDVVLAANVLVTPAPEEVQQHAQLNCLNYLRHIICTILAGQKMKNFIDPTSVETYQLIFGFLFFIITAVITLRFY